MQGTSHPILIGLCCVVVANHNGTVYAVAVGAAAAAGLQGQLAVLRQLWLTNIKAELKYGRRRYNMCQHRGVPTIHALAGGPFVRGVNSMLQVATDKAAYCSACTAHDAGGRLHA